MVPLQSAAPPALGPPLVMFVLACLFAVVAGGTASAVVSRLSNPVAKFRYLYLGLIGPLGLFTYALLAVLEFGAAVRGAVLGPIDGTVGGLAMAGAELATTLAAGVVVLAAYAPTVRGVRSVRDIEVTTGRAVVRMARFVFGIAALFALVLTPFRLGIDAGASPAAIALGISVFAVALLAASPWVLEAVQSTHRPTEAEAERIAALCERAGVSTDLADGTRLLESSDEQTAGASVRGLGPTRRLFVTTTFLEAFDDETAAALLAVQAGRVEVRAMLRRIGAVVAAMVPLLAAFGGGDGPDGLLVAVAGGHCSRGSGSPGAGSGVPTITRPSGSGRTRSPTRSSGTRTSTTWSRPDGDSRTRCRSTSRSAIGSTASATDRPTAPRRIARRHTWGHTCRSGDI
ncbi:peptidase [Halobaculum litoreum]|uniref:Peptidase n=1 Tax=Halobaculum litoreum TaxID=3031998 RepID=A0ABD5XX94_9EURY